MQPIQNILVGTDFSEASGNAVREASRIAEQLGAKLHIVHVVDDRCIRTEGADSLAPLEEIIGGAQCRVEAEFSDLADESATARSEVLVGHPFKELFQAVMDWNIDLLILGSRGYGKDKVGRLGVIASKCVRKVNCPVLLVRPQQHEPLKRIVACVDYSKASRRAMEYALLMARIDGCRLEVLHVDPTSQYIMTNYGSFALASPGTSLVEMHDQQLEVLEKFICEFGELAEDIEITPIVIQDSPVANAIAHRLREEKADLAVVGTRGGSGILGLILGTTAEALIHDSPCSILAVKPEEFHWDLNTDVASKRHWESIRASGEAFPL